jgi:hypothetical protein
MARLGLRPIREMLLPAGSVKAGQAKEVRFDAAQAPRADDHGHQGAARSRFA